MTRKRPDYTEARNYYKKEREMSTLLFKISLQNSIILYQHLENKQQTKDGLQKEKKGLILKKQ